MGKERISLSVHLPLSEQGISMTNYLVKSRAETIGLLVIVWSPISDNHVQNPQPGRPTFSLLPFRTKGSGITGKRIILSDFPDASRGRGFPVDQPLFRPVDGIFIFPL